VDVVVHNLLLEVDKEHTLKSVRDCCRVILHVRLLHITDVAELIFMDATDAGPCGQMVMKHRCALWVAGVEDHTAFQCIAV